MITYQVAERFLSINGEGPRAGALAYFIRFRGCNLSCSWCDTRWACDPAGPAEEMDPFTLADAAVTSGAESATLTGGEPLLQPDIDTLFLAFHAARLPVEVETNGSVDISPFDNPFYRPHFTMDYKLPGSGMEGRMLRKNLSLLQEGDVLKLVCASVEDLERGAEIAQEFSLLGRVPVYFSPVFGKLHPAQIVDFLKERKLPGVRLQLQLHKFIWPPEMRGV